MPKLVLQPTATAQWHALVNEAEAACARRLPIDLQSYLVFLLMRFANKPELVARVMAVEFLQGMLAHGHLQESRLRDVGDQCLLFAGLFPEQAPQRMVEVDYFVALGRTAYGTLASASDSENATMFEQLSQGFEVLTEILQAMRGTSEALPLGELVRNEDNGFFMH